MANGTTDKDMGAQAIMKSVRKAKGSYVEVGYWGPKMHPESDGYTVTAIAAVQEYGTKEGTTPVIPERSFMRTSADEHREDYRKRMGDIGRRLCETKGQGLDRMLAGLGELILSDMQNKISDGDPSWKELSDATKARRRSGPGRHFEGHKPLVDTGYLRAAGGTRVVMQGVTVSEAGAN